MRTQLISQKSQEQLRKICNWFDEWKQPNIQIIDCYHTIEITTRIYRDEEITAKEYETLMKTVFYLYFQTQPEDRAQKEIRRIASRYVNYFDKQLYQRAYETESSNAAHLKDASFDTWVLVDQFIEEIYNDRNKEII